MVRIGDVVPLDGYNARVIEMKGRRVSKVLLVPAPAVVTPELPPA
jgi:hypothetical protein